MNNVLEVNGLRKSYNDFVLDDVSFTIPENCITGFIGVNGAGKSTTIRNILGLALREAGTVKFFGKNVDSAEQEIKNRVGVVLDDGAFYENLSMEAMKSILAPAYSSWSEKSYKYYMDRFGLNPRQKISTLSKGMKVKFALTIALSHHADLLIMDEPTSGLDPLVRTQLMDILLEYLKEKGKSIFFSTHITSDLDRVADMLILIDKGHIVFQQDKDVLLDSYRKVKGALSDLSDEIRELFLSVQKTEYGFTGITVQPEKIKALCRQTIISEKATIEDIMLAHIGGAER